MNCVLKYPGGKWRIANWITSFIQEHKVYLEPYAGSAAVFFNKKPVQIETLNDIDGRIVNFFKVCREHPAELAALINLTPFSRNEFESVQEDHAGESIKLTGDNLEDARRFAIRCWQGFGSKLADRVGWKNTKVSHGPALPYIWSNLPAIILQVADRLKNAQIECRPAVELIKKYNMEDCLIYADPPYLSQTRTGRMYSFEMGGVKPHIEMINALNEHKGQVILSGYDNELYNDMLLEWKKEYKNTVTNSAKSKTEVLWIKNGKNTLFDYMRETNV